MDDRLVQANVLATDLQAARHRLEELGFTVLDGGRHPGRGTANLIVPFGRQYLEILAVVDDAEARSSPQGRPVVAALAERGPGLARWSVEAHDIDATAKRVGHPVERRHRLRPDGTSITWRSVAVDAAWSEPWRCAFMAWDDPDTHPARGAVAHPNRATGFARLRVVVPDWAPILAWLGGQVPPGVVVEVGAPPDVTELHVSSPSGTIALDSLVPSERPPD